MDRLHKTRSADIIINSRCCAIEICYDQFEEEANRNISVFSMDCQNACVRRRIKEGIILKEIDKNIKISINQLINQSINQSIDRSINQSINQQKTHSVYLYFLQTITTSTTTLPHAFLVDRLHKTRSADIIINSRCCAIEICYDPKKTRKL